MFLILVSKLTCSKTDVPKALLSFLNLLFLFKPCFRKTFFKLRRKSFLSLALGSF